MNPNVRTVFEDMVSVLAATIRNAVSNGISDEDIAEAQRQLVNVINADIRVNLPRPTRPPQRNA